MAQSVTTPQKKGCNFEQKLHDILEQTKCKILREADIKRKYGVNVSGIDHLIYHKKIIICMQDKWQSKTISIGDFNHFSKCVEEISKHPDSVNIINFIAIYASNQNLSANSREQFDKENERYRNKTSKIRYYTCYDSDENVIISKLQHFLHKNCIFLYDAEGDSLMV